MCMVVIVLTVTVCLTMGPRIWIHQGNLNVLLQKLARFSLLCGQCLMDDAVYHEYNFEGTLKALTRSHGA